MRVTSGKVGDSGQARLGIRTGSCNDGNSGVCINPVHLAIHLKRLVRVVLCNTLDIELAYDFGIFAPEPSSRLTYLSTHRYYLKPMKLVTLIASRTTGGKPVAWRPWALSPACLPQT